MRNSDNSIVTILILVAIIAVLGVLFALRVMNAGNVNTNTQGQVTEELNKGNAGTSGGSQVQGTQTNEMTEQAFNSRFAPYIGQRRDGVSVKKLIDEVNKNNTTYKNRNVTVEYGGTNYTNNLIGLSDTISIMSQYEVKVEYNEDRYINKITINKVD